MAAVIEVHLGWPLRRVVGKLLPLLGVVRGSAATLLTLRVRYVRGTHYWNRGWSAQLSG